MAKNPHLQGIEVLESTQLALYVFRDGNDKERGCKLVRIKTECESYTVTIYALEGIGQDSRYFDREEVALNAFKQFVECSPIIDFQRS